MKARNSSKEKDSKEEKQMAIQPFLFRFKKRCTSANRVPHNSEFYYDAELHQVVTIQDGRVIPAIEAKKNYGPKTKKADIEKGEDQKDKRMW